MIRRQIDAQPFAQVNHIEQQALYFRFVSAGKVFLHRGGAMRVELVNDFQVIRYGVFGEDYTQLAPDFGTFLR